jgi:uncharacterized protein DUF4395
LSRPVHVDSKVPRAKAAFHTLLPALAFVIQGIPGAVIVTLTGAAMALSVVAGPRFSVIGIAARAILKRLNSGPGRNEFSIPHTFAEAIGAVFLLASGAFLFAGLGVVGWTLTLIVVGLAALNWLAGICVGCQMYLLIARIRGRTTGLVAE